MPCGAIISKVKAMRELHVGPGRIGFEKGLSDAQNRWIVARAAGVCTIGGDFEARVIQGVVLRVSSDSDRGLAAGQVPEIIQEVVGECIGRGDIACIGFSSSDSNSDSDIDLSRLRSFLTCIIGKEG